MLRVGRRGGKTRAAFVAAIGGHGPGWREHTPTFPGVLQGRDVMWLSRTVSNLTTVLWGEEIVPRMEHLPWVTLRTSPAHDVAIPGLGALLLRSADREAIDSVRGVGARLGGVILDEAAFFDLRGALQQVILPALADNGGWLMLMSSTNSGQDGGYDEAGQPQRPSYFNIICAQIAAGERSPEWTQFTGTGFDNPTMSVGGMQAVVDEYAPDSPALAEEVYAELLTTGVGLALPQVSAARHLIPALDVPSHWFQFGCLDWGFNHPWCCGWFAWGDDGECVLRDTLWGRQDVPEEIARQIVAAFPVDQLKIVYAGIDVFAKKGRSIGKGGGQSIADPLRAAGLPMREARSVERVLGLDNLRRYLAWQPTATTKQREPRFRLVDTPGNRRVLTQLQAMQLDPDRPEDALKVDADHAGRGGDDGYDMVRYALISRPITGKKPKQAEIAEARSPGYDYEQQRPRERPDPEQEIATMFERARPHVTAGRFNMPRRAR